MTCDEQLARWVEGESIHNEERDECCPDFSCCQPSLLADKSVRERFRDATDEERHSMLFGFFGAAVAAEAASVELDVYIAGDPANHMGEQ